MADVRRRFYDLERSYHRLVDADSWELRGMAANIEAEAGTSDAAFASRSAIRHARAIHAPTLILNGAQDPRIDAAEIEAFGKALEANGTPARTVVYPDFGHAIDVETRNREIGPFLQRYLGFSY